MGRPPFEWLNDNSRQFLATEHGYLVDDATPEGRLKQVCDTAESILKKRGFGQRLWDCLAAGWFSLSTPIWTNFGLKRGLPISCFGSYCDDSIDSILDTHAEVGKMSQMGGGTAIYVNPLRPRGSGIDGNGQSHGPVPFLPMFDVNISTISQGMTRRGNAAVYMRIDHPDFMEFLQIRTDASPVKNLFPAVCVPDYWLEEMVAGDEAKREIWAAVLEARFKRALPYIIFIDNANKFAPDVYRDKGMEIFHSQLCTEIFLPTGPTESFVCDLASMVVRWFREWRNTDAVEVMTYLLDAVMTEFIDKASAHKHLARAVKFARRHRALGIGWVGWHSLLQSEMTPFESMEAKLLNVEVARTIQEQAWEASRRLAAEYGEPEVLEGYGRRNTCLTAIAPTTSSSWIAGQMSKSVEPDHFMTGFENLAKGKFLVRNRFLDRLLTAKGLDAQAKARAWEAVNRAGGSCQKLACLTGREKAVFKTFSEISPREIIIQAAGRQKYLDQGQSLNLMIHPDTPVREANALTLEAWRLGLKSLYYQYGVNAAQEFCRDIMSCSSCEA